MRGALPVRRVPDSVTFDATSAIDARDRRSATDAAPVANGPNPGAVASIRYVFEGSRAAAKLPFTGVR